MSKINLKLNIDKKDFKKKLDIKDGKDGKDGSEDTGAKIINKINDVPVSGPLIDASHIGNLVSFVTKRTSGGGGGGTGSGDVIGPALNTDSYIPQWDGANSKTLKNGLAVPAGGLAGITALDGKLSLDQTISQTIVNGQPIQDTLTASQIVATDASKKLQSLAVATYPSLAELAFVKGVSSSIQTQLNAKGVGDMVLASVQSVTGLKTFDTTKIAVKGSSTGATAIASANAGASDYTQTLQAKSGTIQTIEDIKIMQGTFDLKAQYQVDSDLWLLDLHADQYPYGIYITKVYVDCTVADPTTELNANLMYCDAVAGGAFPGANPTLIVAIDTTTGNFADASVNTSVATGKSLYIDMDADPVDLNTQWHIRIHYYIKTS